MLESIAPLPATQTREGPSPRPSPRKRGEGAQWTERVGHFRYGLTIAATIPASTPRTWRSSPPISTASWASSRSSARFSFSTLIFSTQETGSPSGVRQIGNSADILNPPSLFGGRFALARLLLRTGLREDHLTDQIFEANRRLGEFDPAAGRYHLFRAAGHQRHESVAEQAGGDDLGYGVVGQLVGRIDAHAHGGEEAFGIERLRHDRADLDAGDAHVAAVADAGDAVELRSHLVALHRPHLARGIGGEQKPARDGQHHRDHHRLDHVPGHPPFRSYSGVHGS